MNEIFSLVFIGIGVVFDFLGCLGLLRLPDVYNRLQAATKSVTLGTWSILFGVFLRYGFTGVGVKALICIPLIYYKNEWKQG
jgi:multicomponent Na+:H+ antiporter subunit G